MFPFAHDAISSEKTSAKSHRFMNLSLERLSHTFFKYFAGMIIVRMLFYENMALKEVHHARESHHSR